jgi:thymidine kinase
MYNYMAQTEVHLILGPMRANKSTELIRRANCYMAIDKKVLIINHSFDTRTDDSIQTHSGLKLPAMKTDLLMKITNNTNFIESDAIFIDEGQFFDDLREFVLFVESNYTKVIVIAGLDGDFKREPFFNILNVIPLADSIQKFTSFCMIEKDGTPAIFSKRISSNDSKILIGDDQYLSVCRKNYIKN